MTVLGIDDDNPYFPIATADKKNEIVISSAAAQKFGVKVGDKLVLSDEVNERDYAFTVKNIVHFTSGVYVFWIGMSCRNCLIRRTIIIM